MKKILATTLLLFFCQFCCVFAQSGEKDDVKVQKKLEPYDPISAIEKAEAAFEKEFYRQSLKHYEKIHPNDTLYVGSLLQRVVCILNIEDGDFQAAIDLCDEGIAINEDHLTLFTLNKGVAYNKLERYEDAIKLFEEGIERFPYYSAFYVYKGYNYKDLEQYDKALTAFQEAATMFPFNSEAHTALAVLAMESGALTQAVLSLTTSLLIEPDSPKSLTVLSGVNDLVSEKQEVKIKTLKINNSEESFEDVDQLIQNYIALDAKYKIPSKLSYPFIKQLYLVLTESDKTQKGFWTKTYMPIYEKILKNDLFEPFSYLISYSSENDRHQALFEKKLKDIKAVNETCTNWWSEQHEWRDAPEQLDLDQAHYWYSSPGIELIGGYNKSTKQLSGPCMFIDDEGYVVRTGQVSKAGDATGLWKYYYQNGNLSRTSEFKEGKLNGETVVYLQNGNTRFKRNFKNDDPHGLSEYYKQVGYKYEELNYDNGKAVGTMNGFFSNGDLKYEFEYKDDQRNGKYVVYFPDGKIAAKGKFVNDKIDGLFERFYHNGQKSTVVNYNQGDYEGDYETYYSNGQLNNKGKYAENTQVGEWLTYAYDGKLIEKENFDEKGKLTGTSIEYDEDGNKVVEFSYKNGSMNGYKCYAPDGTVLAEDESKKGLSRLESVSPWGSKQTEGAFVKGERDGLWKFHDMYGNLDDEIEYKEGVAHGVSRSYFRDGSLYYEYNNEDGEKTGLHTQYYPNGAVEYYVYYSDNDFEGRYLNYSPKGDLNSDQYYTDGNQHGWNHFHNNDGRLWSKIKFDKGFPLEILRFGPDGETWGHSKFVNGDGTDSYTYPNGVKALSRIYKGGSLEGLTTVYFPNKQLSAKGEYVSGDKHGPWTWYFSNGQIKEEGSYIFGDLEGPYKEYFKDGSVDAESNYREGKLDGMYTSYFRNGNLSVTINYKFGKRHGERTSYSPDGGVQIVEYYDNGRLYGYAHQDANGKLKEMVPIENGNAEISTVFPNGKPAIQQTWKNGLVEGAFKTFYLNGQNRINATYKQGFRHGKCQWFHENGQLDFEADYYYGDKMGKGTYYYPNGKVKSTGNYYLNEKEGTFEYFDENGQLTETRLYFGDTLYEIK